MVLIFGLVLTLFLVLVLGGAQSWSGPVLWTFGSSHGVHEGDLPVIVLWLVGMVGAVALWSPPRD